MNRADLRRGRGGRARRRDHHGRDPGVLRLPRPAAARPCRVRHAPGRGPDLQGLGGLGAVSDIESPVGGLAPLVTFTLSGVGPAIAADVVDARTQVKGRDCTLYLQLYGADLAPLGGLYTLYRGIMDRLTHTASGPDSWTAQLTAETRFARRGLPPFGNLTHADQQRRHPGDDGLFDIAQMVNRRRPWNPEIPEKS
ncbi:hypothetical protein M6G65_01530 [Methylobacterium tardum]|uniref:hypothetical protein n=1 Tax=Methylobacterium tardum TaxID=374432 RepID=UPI0020219CEB|nr:hypothetical protein [Methylobacterium tardum]URD37311.1 hypothetical protein M6G65_01530 [Methylobacterium tardum]